MRSRSAVPVLALCALGACAPLPAVGSAPHAHAAATKKIRVDDFFFRPKRTAVRHGTVVVWRFRGSERHNVKVTRGPVKFKSHTMRSGTFKKRLRRRGTYRYVCTIHPDLMRGKITVR